MSRQSISFSGPNTKWLHRKVTIEQEYKSNSEAVNDLIRRARESEAIRKHSGAAGQNGMVEHNLEAILADIRNELRPAPNTRRRGS